MQKLLNYPVIGLVIFIVLIIIYLSMVQDQKDKIATELEQSQQQITRLLEANKNLSQSIDLLEQQAKEHRAYVTELESKQKATQQQANSLIQQFKRQQRDDKTINDWSSQPLPDGLY